MSNAYSEQSWLVDPISPSCSPPPPQRPAPTSQAERGREDDEVGASLIPPLCDGRTEGTASLSSLRMPGTW
jgi:hypothetical protein